MKHSLTTTCISPQHFNKMIFTQIRKCNSPQHLKKKEIYANSQVWWEMSWWVEGFYKMLWWKHHNSCCGEDAAVQMMLWCHINIIGVLYRHLLDNYYAYANQYTYGIQILPDIRLFLKSTKNIDIYLTIIMRMQTNTLMTFRFCQTSDFFLKSTKNIGIYSIIIMRMQTNTLMAFRFCQTSDFFSEVNIGVCMLRYRQTRHIIILPPFLISLLLCMVLF